jgi:excisionase family DNA binding protein
LGYSRRELAESLGISHRFVIDLVKRGELPTFKLGRLVFVPAAAVDLLISRAMENFRPEPVMIRLLGLTDDRREPHRRPA